MRDLLIRLYALFHDPQSPIYEDKVYVPVGVALILISLSIGIIYYFVLNGIRERFSERWPYWWGCLFLNLFIGFLTPILIVRNLGDDQAGPFSSDTLILCLINCGYAVVAFFLVSMAFKWFSPHARRTPF
jgi:hypothetical protein